MPKFAKKNHTIKKIISHLSIDSLSVAYFMIALGLCDGIICGTHAYSMKIRSNKVHTERVKVQSALADGDVIHPHISAKAKHGFVQKIAQLNNAVPKNDRITPSLEIAQAALESNWGQSDLYKRANNIFNMKGEYNGNYMMYDTGEVKDGHNYTELSDFRQYPTLEIAVKDHNKLLKQKFLQGSKPNDYVSEAKALQGNGYATDPNYARKLMDIIQNYHLTRFD